MSFATGLHDTFVRTYHGVVPRRARPKSLISIRLRNEFERTRVTTFIHFIWSENKKSRESINVTIPKSKENENHRYARKQAEEMNAFRISMNESYELLVDEIYSRESLAIVDFPELEDGSDSDDIKSDDDDSSGGGKESVDN